MGFRADASSFGGAAGAETRHTFGIRRFGQIGERWTYNTELVYQFGKLSDQDIEAFNVETDWHLTFSGASWRPSVGLKLELTSGDGKPGDGEINTFNPMFTNPAYYSLAAAIAPVNLKSVHPSLTLRPSEKLELYLEWATFWRESEYDGLYSPPRFLAREGLQTRAKRIGHQTGVRISYEPGRHLALDLDLSYFVAGPFLEATGEAADSLHVAPTVSLKF